MTSDGPHARGAKPDGGPLLELVNLTVTFAGAGTTIRALADVNLTLREGEIVGMAGESGSGKSTVALAIMGLLPPAARTSGSVLYRNMDLVGLPAHRMREMRGQEIAMVFQETVTALNPVVRVGDQLLRAVRAHVPLTRGEALDRIRSSLRRVRLDDTERILASYPMQLSGGMCQRVLIAMAIGCGSKVLLADEPTTALDVSVQQEILKLIKALAGDGMAVLMISHDLAVLNEVADRLIVLYAGQVVEDGPARSLIRAPAHPYSKALLACVPRMRSVQSSFVEIRDGTVDMSGEDRGCAFRTRCAFRFDRCDTGPSLLALGEENRHSRCWRATELAS